jgi:hypothetical protein
MHVCDWRTSTNENKMVKQSYPTQECFPFFICNVPLMKIFNNMICMVYKQNKTKWKSNDQNVGQMQQLFPILLKFLYLFHYHSSP